MHLRIDTKQKIKYIRTYLNQLKTSKQTSPFITIHSSQCGLYDYDYITRKRFTISQIEKNLKDNKYENVKEICQDLKHLYFNICDYLLLTDPLQDQMVKLIKGVSEFQQKFSQDFRENNRLIKSCRKQDIKIKQDQNKDINREKQRQKQREKQKQKQKEKEKKQSQEYNRKSTFAQKLEMFFYLKSHEDNMQYIKSIGDGYAIGKQQTDGEYVIKLEVGAPSCPWLELLQKKQQ